jgi:glycosyltransferase involved in cell wall biosynthesis
MSINPLKVQRPRIAHTINSLGVGGVETICLEVLRDFSDWADNALLVVDAEHQPKRAEFEQLGIPITTLNHLPGQYFQLIYKSYRYFRQHPADALICWSFGNHVFISLGAKLAGVPRIIASVQNAPPRELKQQAKWRSLALLGFVSGADLVACSNYVRDCLIHDLKLPSHRIAVIPNGCNVYAIYQRAQAAKVNKPANPIIGMIARLNEIKDQNTLIRAMPLVLAKYPNAELWLVGDGEQRENLKKITDDLNLTDTVKFLGNRQDIPELLGQMDVFAFSTTEAEGFGIALIEALAAGVPVVASNVGPCAEVLQQSQWGCLVQPGNPILLGDVVVNVLDCSPHSLSLIDVAQKYDISIVAKAYRDCLNFVC